MRGGVPFELCPASTPRGASWGAGDVIVFSDGTSLWRTDSAGSACTEIAAPDTAAGELRLAWPTLLPGGEAVLFELVGEGSSRLAVRPLAGGEVRTVIEGGSDARYLPTGHIVYARGGALFALPFDSSTLSATGNPGEPVWHPNATELFYREGDRLMSVSLDPEPGNGALRPTRPEVVFEGRFALGQSGNRYYDIHPDGDRFLMLQAAGPDPQRPRINVVLNWFSELEQAFAR